MNSIAVRRPILGALADLMGVLPAYVGLDGLQHPTSDATRIALLAAMGVDASTEAAAAGALGEQRNIARESPLRPVRVVSQSATRRLAVMERWPGTSGNELTDWEVEIIEEAGGRNRATGRARPGANGVSVRFAHPLPLGYHTLHVTARTRGGRRFQGTQSLIVTPGRCFTSTIQPGRRRLYGLLTQLYTVRSDANWGIGDLGDLKKLVAWGARIGAAFVGLNPLHALGNCGNEISPYSPVSRLYRNVAYLDVTAVPELAEAPVAAKRLRSPAFERDLRRLRESTHVDYERVMACKRPVLEMLHRAFAARHRGRATPRGRAYRRYVATEGETLTDFATFLTLQSRLGDRRRCSRDWHTWPAAYRDPRSATVRAFAREHAEEINFHRYMQFELDRQLRAACTKARSAGLAIGLYQDLAIGCSPAGSDTWAFPGLFLHEATLGAPPDAFHTLGQDWGLPPIDPRGLATDGYRYWIRLVRTSLGHAGALRMDHVMGLFRQFWVPVGRPAKQGAYVRFPAEDLLGILALESTRAGALVIGEDLGTVPRGFARKLARWGILCTRVLYFARNAHGSFWPARAYPRLALVSANTHDMAPLAGYWSGHDIELRQKSRQFRSDAASAAARSERVRERRLLLRRLSAEGLLPSAAEPRCVPELVSAVHGFLCRTPAALVGIALDDLVGEVGPVNMPGVGADRFRSWSRRLRLPLEAFPSDPDVATALQGALKGRRARRPTAAAGNPEQRSPAAVCRRPLKAEDASSTWRHPRNHGPASLRQPGRENGKSGEGRRRHSSHALSKRTKRARRP